MVYMSISEFWIVLVNIGLFGSLNHNGPNLVFSGNFFNGVFLSVG